MHGGSSSQGKSFGVLSVCERAWGLKVSHCNGLLPEQYLPFNGLHAKSAVIVM
jgi:hypothetical protein